MTSVGYCLFGMIQLMPQGGFDLIDRTLNYRYTSARWQQTANHGYLPNDAMKRTFLAVTIDLPAHVNNQSSRDESHARYDLSTCWKTGAREGFLLVEQAPLLPSPPSSTTLLSLSFPFLSLSLINRPLTPFTSFPFLHSLPLFPPLSPLLIFPWK